MQKKGAAMREQMKAVVASEVMASVGANGKGISGAMFESFIDCLSLDEAEDKEFRLFLSGLLGAKALSMSIDGDSGGTDVSAMLLANGIPAGPAGSVIWKHMQTAIRRALNMEISQTLEENGQEVLALLKHPFGVWLGLGAEEASDAKRMETFLDSASQLERPLAEEVLKVLSFASNQGQDYLLNREMSLKGVSVYGELVRLGAAEALEAMLLDTEVPQARRRASALRA